MMSESNKMIPTEIQLVERVFLKIVFAESDDQFESALNSFLAPVLLKLASSTVDVRQKVLELLTHVNKRLKSRPLVLLPMDALLAQYESYDTPLMARNFSFIYVKMAIQRSIKERQVELIPRLLNCFSDKIEQHRDVLMQLVLLNIKDLVYPDSLEERRILLSPPSRDPATTKYLLQYLLDFLLLPYSQTDDALPPPGLSKTVAQRLQADPPFTTEQTENAKLGVLQFLSSGIFKEDQVIVHFIVACADTKHTIADRSENLIKKFSSMETWDITSVVNKLLLVYQGSSLNPGDMSQGIPADHRLPVSIRFKLKMIPFLLKSQAVINMNPAVCIQIIYDGLFGEATNLRLKKYAIDMCHHACNYTSDAAKTCYGPLLYQALSKIAMNTSIDVSLRTTAFAGLNKLSRCVPAVIQRDVPLVQKMFSLIEKEGTEMQVVIQKSIASVAEAYHGLVGANLSTVEKLLLDKIESAFPTIRLATLQFAVNAFASTHVLSRYICLLVVADSSDEIRDQAKRALVPRPNESMVDFYPAYGIMCAYLFSRWQERASVIQKSLLPFPNTVVEHMIEYLQKCLHANANITEQQWLEENFLEPLSSFVQNILQCNPSDVWTTSIGYHLSMLDFILKLELGAVLHKLSLNCLLELLASCPYRISPVYHDKSMDRIQSFLAHSNEEVRENAARILSILLSKFDQQEFCSKIKDMTQNCEKKELEETHGNILCICFALARRTSLDASGITPISAEVLFEVTESMVSFLSHNDSVINYAACVGIGELGKTIQFKEDHQKLLVIKLKSLLQLEDNKIQEKAASALGFICTKYFLYKDDVINALFDSIKENQPEIHFTVGEALSCVGAGALSTASKNKWALMTQIIMPEENSVNIDQQNNLRHIKTPDVNDDIKMKEMEPHDVMQTIILRIIKEFVQDTKPSKRQAAAIWLLNIVKHASAHSTVQLQLRNIQSAFTNLLADSDEITQDVASRGLALVYDRSGTENRDDLVKVLVEQLMSGKQTKRVIEDETELFKPGALGSSPDGGNLSTYKELCSLATSLNRPDLMYKFMNLANHNALWNSRKGAAFGFLRVATLAGDQMEPHLEKIIPKLYRFQYDPNTDVQKSMSNIWSALVTDRKKVIDTYSKVILSDLLDNILSKQWRTRESCCLALVDILKSCDADDVVLSLSIVWNVVYRVMDDVKESVRTASLLLAKALARLSIRLCDTASKLGERAISEVLPVLLDIGLASSVADVKAISLDTLVKLSKNAGPLLKPHLPVFLPALLESLSGLESRKLQELHLQLSGSVEAQEKIDTVRLSISKDSPMMDAINICVLHVDEEVMCRLLPRLTELLKTGIGLGTKVGSCSFVVSLSLQLRDTITPYAGKLLAALLSGLSDRNVSIKKAYSNAMGHLIRYAQVSSIEKLMLKMKGWYFDKGDTSLQISTAMVINSISLHATDVFVSHATLFLPLVFVAMHEKKDIESTKEEKTCADIWNQIWITNIPGTHSGIKMYLTEILVLVKPLLDSSSWDIRSQAARSIASVAEHLGSNLQQPELGDLLSVLLENMSGRIWLGKESMLKALSSICVECRTMIENSYSSNEKCPPIDKIVNALVKECSKDSLAYKIQALECTSAVLDAWNINRFEQMKQHILLLLNKKENNVDEEEDDTSNSKSSTDDDQLVWEALGRIFPSNTVQQECALQLLIDQCSVKMNKSTWKVQQAIFNTLKLAVERINWPSACSNLINEANNSHAQIFSEAIMEEACTCLEETNYKSVKISGCKFISSLYIQAKEHSELYAFIGKFSDRLLRIISVMLLSMDYEVPIHYKELKKIIDELRI